MPRGVYDRSTGKKKFAKKPGIGRMPRTKPSREPEQLHLTENEVLKMEKLSTQVRACDGDQMITLSQKNAYIQKVDPQGVIARFDQRLTALRQERQEAEQEYRAVTALINKRLGIDLKDYAYDDKSGVLRKVDGDVAPLPPEVPTA